MTASPPAASPHGRTDARTRRRLIALAAIAIAPVILSYLAYYLLPRDTRVNYGTLLATAPLPAITGTQLDGAPFAGAGLRGRWIILHVASGACDAGCGEALYASRQARTIQNAERERIARVWLVPDDKTPPPAIVGAQEDLAIVRVTPQALAGLPEGARRIYLIDPLGNLVLAWPANPDIKAMAKDLTRLLRASRIG
jgi:hypothetical protein